MNIAVFGWYHHQNAGDDRIQRCLTRWLDGHTLAFLPAGRPAPVSLLRTYDAAIIGGGGLISQRGGVFRAMRGWLRAAGIPAALVGVSVENLDSDLRRELRAFMDRAVFTWFRDQGSLEAVGSHPRAFVAPDLTWLYPHPPADARDVEDPAGGDGIAVSLRAEKGLDPDAWRASLEALGARLHAWPFYFEGGDRVNPGGDAALLANLLDQPPLHEFDLAPVYRASAVIAGRFHAAQFAIQAGRPLVAVSSRPKMHRFLDEHGLGDFCISEDRPEDLPSVWRRLRDERASLTARLRALRARLHDRAWSATEPHRDRLLDAAASLPPPHRRFGLRRIFR